MVSSEENQPADDDIRDLQNKRKFSTFEINPNFEPFSDSNGSIFLIFNVSAYFPVEDYNSVNTHMAHIWYRPYKNLIEPVISNRISQIERESSSGGDQE